MSTSSHGERRQLLYAHLSLRVRLGIALGVLLAFLRPQAGAVTQVAGL